MLHMHEYGQRQVRPACYAHVWRRRVVTSRVELQELRIKDANGRLKRRDQVQVDSRPERAVRARMRKLLREEEKVEVLAERCAGLS
eukprot:1127751-Rhodomonas_salina.3